MVGSGHPTTSGSTNLGYGLQGDQVIVSGIFQNSACEEWYQIQFRETQATGLFPLGMYGLIDRGWKTNHPAKP
jgi:hypothetical protein